MAKKKRTTGKTPAKRRKAKKSGLSGIGLGNFKKVNQKEVIEMLTAGGAVVLGTLAGQIGGKLVKKAIIKPGDEEGLKKWITPLTQAGAGVLLSIGGKGNTFVKFLGTGITVSGIIEGVETATGKTISELVGADDEEVIEGLGETIEDINFDLELPVLENENYRIEGLDDDDDDDDYYDDDEEDINPY